MSWKDRARRRATEKSEGDSFKLKEGSNTFRILPNKEGSELEPFAELRMHYEVGPEKAKVRCGKSIDGTGECWLCDDKLPGLVKRKPKIAERMEGSDAFVLQVSSVDPEETDPKKQFRKPRPFWVSSRRIQVGLLQMLSSTKRSYEDPVKGRNITIMRTGSGMRDTRYGVLEPDENPTKVPKSVLAAMKTFDELLPVYDEQKQKNAYLGRNDDESEFDEEAEEEEIEVPKKAKKQKLQDLEDDEEEEEIEEEEDEEEDDEETEDEEVEEEDEEEEDPEEEEVEDEDEEAEEENIEDELEEDSPKKVTKKSPAKATKKKAAKAPAKKTTKRR
jgi:hypothetical protein